ncbi:hypothetical protein B0H67DRAFT_592655 [Lasiosphaeris hirsuta]|uniref:Nephrocystin 3-like N-terminal domain-containing protein n=1 Tax=Lasiosphaeris hirsuta TaxID=260670 RepID=A0AA40DIY7_9PEZI|nr:hypothetical protein B0H67DRAFT_592655 [Lasiosphaeris hirsuta]
MNCTHARDGSQVYASCTSTDEPQNQRHMIETMGAYGQPLPPSLLLNLQFHRGQEPERRITIGNQTMTREGRVLLKTEYFQKWKRGSMRAMWICGALEYESGKTTLMSIILGHLIKDTLDHARRACLFVNFDYCEETRRDLKNILSSLRAQLTCFRDPVSGSSSKSFQYPFNKSDGTSTYDNDLKMTLAEIKSFGFARLYLVIDELGEYLCGSEFAPTVLDPFIEFLCQLPHNTHFVFTSRHKQGTDLPEDYKVLETLSGPNQLQEFVRGCLNAYHGPPRSGDRPLSAPYYLDILPIKGKPDSLKSRWETLSRAPNDIRRLLLEKISNQNGFSTTLALRALMWVALACRPLTIDELRAAVTTRLVSANGEWFQLELVDERRLSDVCAGLLLVNRATQIVSLAHDAEAYLKANASSIFGNPQTVLAEMCLSYLLLSREAPSSNKVSTGCGQSIAFQKYAANYWGQHMLSSAEDGQDPGEMYFLARIFLLKAHSHVASAMKVMSDDRFRRERAVGPLHVAAYFGLDVLVRKLLRIVTRPDDINAVTGRGKTAVHWAVTFKHSAVIRALVSCGADVNIPDNDGKTALVEAVMNDDLESVDALLFEAEEIGVHNDLDTQL